MGQPVGELAVVGEQDQPGRVGVEPADRIQAAPGADQLDHGRPPPRLARGRDDPGRLVDAQTSRGSAPTGSPSTRDLVALVDVPRRIGTTVAANRHPARAISVLGPPPRGDPAVGEVLREPHGVASRSRH